MISLPLMLDNSEANIDISLLKGKCVKARFIGKDIVGIYDESDTFTVVELSKNT